jgi:predicted RNA methylase
MKCQIEGCCIEREDLSQHIRLEHGISVQEYKNMFNVKYVIDEEKRKKRGESRRETNQTTKQFRCEICGEACLTEKALHKHYLTSGDSKHSHILFNESNQDDWVECAICGLRRSRLDFHLEAKHKISKEEYEKNYTKCFCNSFLEKQKRNGGVNHTKENYSGTNNPFYGKHHSELSRNSISDTTRMNNAKKLVHYNKGRTHTAETRQKMSQSRSGEKNPMYGKQPVISASYSIHGFRKDIGISVRSTNEANYARYLNYINVQYEFEPKPFVVKTSTGEENCWIDFHLTETDEWVEIKNYLGRDIEKIELVQQQYPAVKIRILYCDSQEWKELEKKYSKLIPLWETSKQNLKLTPELYLENIDLKNITSNGLEFPIEKETIMRLTLCDREKLSELLFEHYRDKGFPENSFFEKELVDDFYMLKKSKIKIDDKTVSLDSNHGYKIRDHFIKEQYAKFREIFEDDFVLKKVIRNRVGLDKTTPEFFAFNDRLLIRGFEVLFPNLRFSKYNASLSKWIVETFCNGDRVFDYSCGWGVRLLGAVVAGKSYIGTDTNLKLVEQLKSLSNWLKNFSNKSIEIINQDAANFKPLNIDLAYSCPPYGIKEQYEEMTIRNNNEWFEIFFKPVVENCYQGLKNGGRFVCHISSDLRDVAAYELQKKMKFLDEFYVKTKYSPFVKTERSRINESILIFEKKI